MEKISMQILGLVEKYRSLCNSIDDPVAGINLNEDSWSIKQIIGHLIDSASNNHQRIVRLLLAKTVEFPDYDKDEWLAVENHNAVGFDVLFELFCNFNRLIAHVISRIPETAYHHYWKTDFLDGKDRITLEELSAHYVDHLAIHFDHLEKRICELNNG